MNTEQLREVLRALRRSPWLALGVAWGVSVLLGAAVLRVQDRFEASARIYIDTQSVLKPLMAGLAFQPNIEQQLSMLARTLISRPTATALRDSPEIGWDNQAGSQDPARREAEIESLMKAIKMAPGGTGTNIYALSYRDTDPQRAQRVVAQMVKIFVASGADNKRKDSQDARAFIEEEIREHEAKLVAAENQLKEFKLKNFGVTGVAAQGYFARMSSLAEEVDKLRMEYRAAEQERDALKRELASEAPQLPAAAPGTPLPAAAAAPLVSEHEPRLEGLRRQLDEMLRRYTDEHPDVVSTRRAIAQLEVQKRQDLEARALAAAAIAAETGKIAPAPTAAAAATNPVFQQLRVSLAATEAKVASLRVRLGTQESRLAETRALANRTPQVEAELSQLNRDYDIIRKNYEALVARRESASLGVKIDESSPLAEFRIIDPPRTAPNAVFPNRLSLAALAALLALAAGVAAALARAKLRPVIDTAKALRELSGRAVLGSVSQLMNPQALRAQRASAWSVFAAGAGLALAQLAWVAWLGTQGKV
ncbi:MAG: chain length-determining protein [Aquincola sp.]|nr:chain length-determining protein [Aquincola sp.]